MIREHGPANSTMKLCLYTVNAFMDDSGEAWPSQTSIAKASSLTENTVQRALGEAIDLGWLGVETRVALGKAWKRYVYRAAVPDSFETSEMMLDDKIMALVTAHHAKYGPIPEGGRPLKKKPGKTVHARPKTPKVPFLKSEVPLLKTEGPHPEGAQVPLLNGKVPLYEGTKFPSEVPNSSSQMKFPHKGAVASDRTSCAGNENLELMKADAEVAEHNRKVLLARKAFAGGLDAEFIKKQYGLTMEDVRRQA